MPGQPRLWQKLFNSLVSPQLEKRRDRSNGCYRRKLGFEQFEDRSLLTVITVTSFADDDGGPKLTLREAIAQSNVNGVDDQIRFSTSPSDGLNGATITLQSELNITEDQDLTIDASILTNGITIEAYDPTPTQKNGDGSRIFNITGGNIELNHLTLTGGDIGGDPGSGGAIYCFGANLTIQNSTISGNASGYKGGGIFFSGTILTIQNSTISGNQSGTVNPGLGRGGGLYADVSHGSLMITDNTAISGNTSNGQVAYGETVTIRGESQFDANRTCAISTLAA